MIVLVMIFAAGLIAITPQVILYQKGHARPMGIPVNRFEASMTYEQKREAFRLTIASEVAAWLLILCIAGAMAGI